RCGIDFVHEILAVTLSPVSGHVKEHRRAAIEAARGSDFDFLTVRRSDLPSAIVKKPKSDPLGFLEDADPAESVVALLDELLPGFRPELPEVVPQRDAQSGSGLRPVAVGAARRLANDRIDRAQAQEVG